MLNTKEPPNTKENEANAYVLNQAVLEAINYMYDHECSIEFIIETIKAAYLEGTKQK